MIKALDYTGRIPGSVLRAMGYLHVFRYLGDPNVWPKAMVQNEVDDLRINQITIHLNYEQAADFMLGGYTAGPAFAREARHWATTLGFDPSVPILYSADFDVSVAQVDTVLAFLNGAASVDGGKSRVGVYGGYRIVKAAIDAGFIGWQTGAWSSGMVDSRAIAWQGGTIYVNGVQCDLNTMNINYLQGTSMATVPQSISDKWSILASDFPPNAPYTLESATIWADAGARYAAYKADEILRAVNGIVVPNGTSLTSADIDAIATAVVNKLAGRLANG